MAITIANASLAFMADMALREILSQLLPLEAFSTDFNPRTGSGQTAAFGDVAKVAVYGASGTADDFNESTNNYEDESAQSLSFVDVTINKHKKRTIGLKQHDYKVDLNELIPLEMQILARDVLKDIMSVITAANFGAPVLDTTTALFDSDDLADIRNAVIDKMGMNKYVCLNGNLYTNLLKDPAIKNADQSGRTSTLGQTMLAPLYDITPIEGRNIPLNGEDLTGFVTDKSGIIVAMAPFTPADSAVSEVVDYEVATHETGLSVVVSKHVRTADRKTFYNFEVYYGYKKGRADGLDRIIDSTIV